MKMNEMLRKVNDYVVFLSFRDGGFTNTVFKCVEENVIYADVSDKYTPELYDDLDSSADMIERFMYAVEYNTIKDQKEVEELFNKLSSEELTLDSEDNIPCVLTYEALCATLTMKMEEYQGRVYIFKGNYEIDSMDKYMVLNVLNGDTKVGTIDKTYVIAFSRDLEHMNINKLEGIGLAKCSMEELKSVKDRFLGIMESIATSEQEVEGLSEYETNDMNSLHNNVSEYLTTDIEGSIFAVAIDSKIDAETMGFMGKMLYNGKEKVVLESVIVLARVSRQFILELIDEHFGDENLNTELTYDDVLHGGTVSLIKNLIESVKADERNILPYADSITFKTLDRAIETGFILMNEHDYEGPKSLFFTDATFENPELNIKTHDDYHKIIDKDDKAVVYATLCELLFEEELELLGKTLTSADFGYSIEDEAMMIMLGEMKIILPKFNMNIIESYVVNPKIKLVMDKVGK